jgi:DNA modification methylase
MKPYYRGDGITIYHGDSLDVLPRLFGRLAFDVVVTDPPYGIGWRRGANPARASRAHRGIANDQDTTVRDAVLALTHTKPAIVFGSFYAPFPRRLRQVLVWRKPNDAGVVGSVTGYRRDAEPIFLVGPWPHRTVRASSVMRNAQGIGYTARQGGHPHSKPIDLLEQLIAACPPGTILDPFMGTGATLLAAKASGRHAIGIEIDERYCAIAARRLEAASAPRAAA